MSLTALSAVLVLVLVLALSMASIASGASPDVVVSQLYAGGGNAGAGFKSDFVELFNRGSAPVDVSSWTLQYAPAAGTAWQATPLSGSIAPGHFYLVSLASTAAVGAPLPTPDGSGAINLATSGGKVAVVRGTADLTCGSRVGSCSSSPLVADLVGYGSATDFEGTKPAAALDGSTAAARAGGGCTDTDSSSVDFTAVKPAPRNSGTSALRCVGTPVPGGGPGRNVAVNLDVQPVLSIALDQATLSFGKVVPGSTPPPLGEHVTVVSNDGAGYALTVHRSVFARGDLPLAVAATAPGKAAVGAGLGGGAFAPIPIAPAPDLVIGTTAAASAGAGDIWPARLGFASALPVVSAGLHTATVTLTVIGR